jgi:lysyl-tRNA synthetase class 2
VVAAYVLHHRSQFRATAEPAALVRGLASAVAGAAVAVIAGTVATQVGGARIPVGRAVAAVSERLVGLSAIALPDRPLDDFLTPCLFAIGVGLAMFSGWVLFRPVVSRHGASELARARDVVRQHGRDTLAYFALRDDKRHFFSADSVVAYAVWGGVCLVSPDPVGPVALRAQVWSDFRQFCDRQGWSVAVLGASEDWLAIYRAAGMQCLYVGDEAVVDCRRFSLEGGRNKGLRQAVNRVARNGYRVEFHDPATLDRELRASLGRVMVRSRRGDVERGFSMTLGRVFDPDDTGLLIAVCYGPSGEPVAFCQYVPAPGIDGYSLDLMRRDQGDHPNGVVDFLVVETIRELQARGMTGLGLNFATFRAVVAGDTGHGLGQQLQRWFLRQMSDSMQIESLWRFTAKYDPDWQPRYAVVDGVEHVIGAALAVARAESFWELPVIGRFLVRAPDEVEPEPVATP